MQTGSGKTFTMSGTRDDAGITPRVVDNIFRSILEAPDTMEFTIRVSYLEIYMEVRFCTCPIAMMHHFFHCFLGTGLHTVAARPRFAQPRQHESGNPAGCRARHFH